MEWLALAIIIIFIVVVAVVAKSRAEKQIAEGKTIKRDISFVRTAEIFTLTGVTTAMVAEKLKALNYSEIGAAVEGSKGTYHFKGRGNWAAQLSLIEQEGEIYKYKFQFTRWETSHNLPMHADRMNMLLTSVEKMFLCSSL